jgi:hypothetical protein
MQQLEFIMFSRLKALIVVASLAAMSGISSAGAAEWSRGTALGGQLTRNVDADGLVYSGETVRTGPNGGSYSSNSTCLDGLFVDRCHRSFSATGPNGETYSGDRLTAWGPNRVRSIGAVAGPDSSVVVETRRRWR